MIALVNLTPHEIVLQGDEQMLVLPGSTEPARVTVTRERVGTVDGIPLNRTVFGEVVNLPPPAPRIGFLVSRPVAEAARDREDLYVVDDVVRDASGRVFGARAVTRI